MTICDDKLARLWCETDQGYGFRTFDLAGAVDPTKYIFGTIPSEVNEIRASSFIHWLSGEALLEAVKSQRGYRNFHNTVSEIKNSKLQDTLLEYPDLVFQIRKNGSMLIWGIQGLGTIPRRVTKIVVLMKYDLTVTEPEIEFFDGPLSSLSISNPDTCPDNAEITFLAQSRASGVLNAYTMCLDDFFSYNWTSPRLNLVHTWCGPSRILKSAIRHPLQPLMCAQDNKLSVKIYKRTPLLGQNTSHLKMIGSLSKSLAIRTMQWIPSTGHTLLAAASAIKLYIVDLDKSASIHSTYETNMEIEGLFIFPTEEPEKFIIFGFNSSSGDIRSWKLSLTSGGYFETLGNHHVDQLISCHAPLPPFLGDFQSILFPYLLATLDGNNKIVLWHFADFSCTLGQVKNHELRAVASFEIDVRHRIKKITFSPLGKCAISCERGNNHFIEIWGNLGTGLEMYLEYRIPVPNAIDAMDWFVTYGGQTILCVGDLEGVQIYMRIATADSYSWSSISKITNETNCHMINLKWLPDGGILGADSVHNFIICPWDHKGVNDSGNANYSRHIFDLCSDFSGRFHDNDPNLLYEYLMGGMSEVVRYNLSLLYRFVEIALEHNRPIDLIPFCLWKLMETEGNASEAIGYEDLFQTTIEGASTVLGHFSALQAKFLSENLPNTKFSHVEDLIAFTNAFVEIESHKDSIDQNGHRFLFAYLFSSFSPNSTRMTSREYVWAYFSDSETYLVEKITQRSGKLTWEKARSVGVGWWIKSNAILKQTFETIARSEYWGEDGSNDPIRCSLFYLALKKKSVLFGLWKLANTHPDQSKMLSFLANDFKEERWKTASLKNAFALLGKQRFHYAASFFLLADQLKDAVNVCLKQLNDPQLAISLCRIYEGENGPVFQELFEPVLIPLAIKLNDRWLQIMLWALAGNKSKAFESLTTQSDLGVPDDEKSEIDFLHPHSYILYDYLKLHRKTIKSFENVELSPYEERQFYLACVRSYEKLGFPTLALLLLKNKNLDKMLEAEVIGNELESNGIVTEIRSSADVNKEYQSTSPRLDQKENGHAQTKELDWSEMENKTSAVGLDWGEMENKKTAVGLDWGELEAEKPSVGLDWGEMESEKPSVGLDWGEMASTVPGDIESFDDPVVNSNTDDSKKNLVQIASNKCTVSKNENDRLLAQNIHVSLYKYLLVMRILQVYDTNQAFSFISIFCVFFHELL
jgi:hypothetical protein